MKKSLLASSALVAAALVAGSVSTASAQSKEGPIQVGLGGYFFGYFAGQNQNSAQASGSQLVDQPGYGVKSNAIFRKSRIQFDGLTNLDNGVKVGFRVQLRGESSRTDQIESSYLFFDTPFGIVQLGKVRGAAYSVHYTNPDIQDADGDPWNLNYGDFNGNIAPLFNTAAPFGASTFIEVGRSEKIVYYTPRLYNFQAGISYAPDGCYTANPSLNDPNGNANTNAMSGVCGNTIGNGFANSNNIGQQSKTVGIGVNYVNKALGPVSLALAAGVAFSSLEANTASNAFKNQSQWNLGGQIGYAGFTFGGAYQQDNLGVSKADLTYNNLGPAGTAFAGNNNKNWSVGLTYDFLERWRVGINYVGASTNDVNLTGASIGTDKYQGWELGGGYTLGPGIVLSAGVEWQKWTSGALTQSSPYYNQANNKGWTYQVGTTLRF